MPLRSNSMTATDDTPLPVGAAFAHDWNTDALPFRVTRGADRAVKGFAKPVWTSVIQFADGSVDDGSILEAPAIHIGDCYLTIAQARALLRVLPSAIEEAARWVTE
jgi:hypothetical protein